MGKSIPCMGVTPDVIGQQVRRSELTLFVMRKCYAHISRVIYCKFSMAFSIFKYCTHKPNLSAPSLIDSDI